MIHTYDKQTLVYVICVMLITIYITYHLIKNKNK